jgi:hypothetical protein
MPRMRLWLIVLIGPSCAAVASAQHPATVFPGAPSLPGMSAPVAFPVDPDPGGFAPPLPGRSPDPLSAESNRQRQIERGTTDVGLDRLATNPALMKQLLALLDDDRRVTRVPFDDVTDGRDGANTAIDQKNLVLLKAIVAEHGWPTIPMVGAAASRAAGAILVHSADHSWQEQLAPELQRLVETGNVFGPDVAEIVDGLLVRSGRPQSSAPRSRFGMERW